MPNRLLKTIATSGLLLLIASSPASAQSNQRAVLDEILKLYKSYDVVLLGEQHDGKLSFEFRMALLRHPRFGSIVQDIVIESANSLYQDLLDDFVLRLKNISAGDLQMVWRNTTMPTGVWDPPIYEEFIRAVRTLNASRRLDKRIRLIAGDPPIDWTKVTSGDQLLKFALQRDETAYTAIENESLAKHRKVLVIYGGAHLVTARVASSPGSTPPTRPTIATYLKMKYPGKTYSIIPLTARYGSVEEFQAVTGIRKTPFLLTLDHSPHASLSAKKFFGFLRDARIGEMMDAILFFGSAPDATVNASPEVENDLDYQNELKRRRDIMSNAVPPNSTLRVVK